MRATSVALGLRGRLARRQVGLRDRAEQRLDLRQRLVRVEVPDDDQGGVVRVIPLVVMGLDDLVGRRPDVLGLADDGMAVWSFLAEQERQDGLLLQVPRPVFVTLQLGDDGALLLLELVLLVDPQVAHAVGLDLQGDLPAVGGEVEMEDGIVGVGVGVVGAAVTLCDLVDVPGHDLVGALEHQVFEVVRQAGAVQFLVGGPDLVGHHRGHDAGAGHGRMPSYRALAALRARFSTSALGAAADGAGATPSSGMRARTVKAVRR